MKNPSFWNTPVTQILQELQTTPQGLSNAEAARRLAVYGANRIKAKRESGTLALLMDSSGAPHPDPDFCCFPVDFSPRPHRCLDHTDDRCGQRTFGILAGTRRGQRR